MEQPRGVRQPDIENQARQPLTAEDLREKREDLEQRVAAVKKQKEDDIAKQLKDREGMMTEDTRLVPLLEEAEGTLEYFETQKRQGLLTNEKDIAELENIRTLVSSLREQKDATLQKYEAIMSNPDVYAKVWEEAHGEKMSRGLKERREGAAQEIQERVNEIAEAIEQLSSQREFAYDELKAKEGALISARVALEKVLDEACGILGPDEYRTADFLKDLRTPATYNEYITGTEQYRKKLGLFKGKEKAAVDYVLRERHEFGEADKRVAEYNEAHQYLEALNAQVDELAEQYKTLLLEAWAKENAIKREFSVAGRVFNDLPHEVHYGLERNLERRAGLGKMEDGRWIPPHSLGGKGDRKRKEEERFNKLNALFRRIEETTGRYLWMNNPEKQE